MHTVLAPQRQAGVQVGNQHHLAEQRLGNLAVGVVHLHQLEQAAGVAVEAGGAVAVHEHLARRQRNEAAASRLVVAQRVDRAHAIVFLAHDDVLQPIAERGGDGALVLLGHIDHVSNDAEHAFTVLLVEQDRADAALIALVVALDLLQGIEPRLQVHELIVRFTGLAFPAAAFLGHGANAFGALLLLAGGGSQALAQGRDIGAAHAGGGLDLGEPLTRFRLLGGELLQAALGIVAAPGLHRQALRHPASRVTKPMTAFFVASTRSAAASTAARADASSASVLAQLGFVDEQELRAFGALGVGGPDRRVDLVLVLAERRTFRLQAADAALTLADFLTEQLDALAQTGAFGLEDRGGLALARQRFLGGRLRRHLFRAFLLRARVSSSTICRSRSRQPAISASSSATAAVSCRHCAPQSARSSWRISSCKARYCSAFFAMRCR